MATIPSPGYSPRVSLPGVVAEKISAVVRRDWGIRFLSAALIALALSLVVLLLALACDWALVLFSPEHRRLLTSGALAVMGLFAIASLAVPLFRRVTPLEAARRIDAQIPELQERMTSLSEFSSSHSSPEFQGSETLIRKVAEEAAQLGQYIEPRRIRTGRELKLAGIVLGAVLALWLLTFLCDPAQMSVLVRRFFSPSSPISLTNLRATSGDIIQPRGSSLKLEAVLSGRPRSSALLSILNPDGSVESHPLELLSGETPRFAFPLKNLQRDLSYRFRSGDGETPWHKITVADRPSLKTVDFRIISPAYSKLPEVRQTGLPKSVQALQGSRLILDLESNVPLTSLTLQGENKVDHTLTPVSGNRYHWELDLQETWAFRPLLVSTHTLTNDHPPRCEIVVNRDTAPVVKIAAPTTDVAVRPEDVVTIAFDAKDDLGVTRAELVIYDGNSSEEKELKSIPIPLREQTGEKSVHAQTELDLKEFKLKHGSELTYAVRVYDSKDTVTTHRPSAAPDSQLASAQPPSDAAPSASDSINQSPPKDSPAQNSPSENSSAQNSPPNDQQTAPPQKQPQAPQEPSKSQPQGGNTWQPKKAGDQSQPPKPAGELAGAPRPDFHMAKHELDTPAGQCSSCARRRITIDEWAGSYASQVLDKLQIEIDPVLKELKKSLLQARDALTQVANRTQAGKTWEADDSAQVRTGDEHLTTADQHVKNLTAKTDSTPYAFIGLQLQDISQLHIQPARHHLSDVTLFDTPSNAEDLATSLVHIERALALLEQLTRQYEAVKLNQKLADTMLRIKKMHQIFLEGTFAMLGSQKPSLNPKERAFMELDLTDDYLKKLQELLKKKLEIQAELAKILSQDPRLLERYMAKSRLEAATLRDQLTLLNQSQQDLLREVKSGLPAPDKLNPGKPEPKLELKNRIPHRIQSAALIAEQSARLLDNYIVWTPLDLDVNQGELADYKAKLVKIVAASAEFASQAHDKKTEPSLETGEKLYQQLRDFRDTLPALVEAGNHPKLPTHVAYRLQETEKLITDISGWIRKERTMDSGHHHLAAEVDQHRITVDTMELSRKLTSLKAQCQGISPELGKTAETFLATMENDLVPELELSQVTLNDNKLAKAVEHQVASVAHFTKAEEQLDAVMDGIIKHLDSLPFDKSPSLPEGAEPESLDDLLAMLEDEARAAEALGIPCCRPSNLIVEKDWFKPGSSGQGGAGSGGGPGRSMSARSQMNQAQNASAMADKLRKQTEDALKKLLKSAGAGNARGIANKRERVWDTLGSKLEDHMRQGRGNLPPEQYRQAIQDYFESLAGKSDSANPPN